MHNSLLLDPVQILHGSNKSLVQDAVFLKNGEINAFGEKARASAKADNITPISAPQQLLAPCLVDPHSFLEAPLNKRSETLESLREKAAHAGYGQLALLPRSQSWRDRADRLMGYNNPNSDVIIHLWGGFSKGGKSLELSKHSELLQHGAIGLAEDDAMPPIELLEKGLALHQINNAPVLFAPRNIAIQGNGLVREGVEAFRAGWAPDPIASETFPLIQLLELSKQYPTIPIRLMNISTADGVAILAKNKQHPMASTTWWHLVKDSASLANNDIGWRVVPSIGRPDDRLALIQGLTNGIITAVAVNSIPLNEEEVQLPAEERIPGLSGYQLVLPALWQELVVKLKWDIEKLWEVLSFGPSRMLNIEEERLSIGSRRWLLFDPYKEWTQTIDNKKKTYCANQPFLGEVILGKVVDSGLKG